MSQPTFAIVIPTFNAEEHLARLLESIRLQANTSYAVAVVDQGSTDRTQEIARESGCTVVEIPRPRRFTPWITAPLPSHSRNVGAASIGGRILLHLDADMELGSADFLEKLEALIDPGHQAAVIHESDVADGFWPRCKALERSCHRGVDMEAARAATRELFTLVGGYDEEVASGEDFVITSLYQQRTAIASSEGLLLFHHTGRYSLVSLLKKKFVYGQTVRNYIRKARAVGGRSATSIAGRSLAAYARNWRLLLSHPLLYMSMFPLRAMEFAAMRLGMLFDRSAESLRSAPIEPAGPRLEDGES